MTHTARYRPGRGPYFAQVPFALQDQVARYQEVPAQERQNLPTLDSFAISVYAAIRRHADFGEETGAAVSDSTVASYAGCSTTTVKKRREALRKVGWLEWESGKRAGEPNRYVVHASLGTEEEGGRRETTTPSSRDDYPGRRETTTTENHNTESQNTETSSDLRSSPGGPGTEEEDTPERRFLLRLRDEPSTGTLVAGVYDFAWLGHELPDSAPPGYGSDRPIATELRKLAEWRGLDGWKDADPEDYLEAGRQLVGLRKLVEAGEVGYVAPGEPFCLGMAEPSREHAGRHLPTAALERGRQIDASGELDPRVVELLEESHV